MPQLAEMISERAEIARKGRDILELAVAERRERTPQEEQQLRYFVARGTQLSGWIETEQSLLGIEERTYLPHREAEKPFPDLEPSMRTPSGKRFASFGEQLTAIVKAATGRGFDSRLVEVRAGQGITETVSSDGGFLVQPEFATEIFKRAYETGQVSSRCRRIPIGAQFNSTKIPAINESSRVDGSRWGGVLSYWVGEGQTYTATRPKFRLMDLTLKKLTGLAYATDEMLQDSQLLESIIMEAFSEEVAFKTDDACIRGTGGGMPLGVLNSPALVTVSAASGSGARLLSADIFAIWSRCWARSRANAVWFMNQDVEPQLYALTLGTATVNQAVYVPNGAIAGAPYSTLMGRPIVLIEQAATMGTVGDIILADMSQYALADKGGLQMAASMHVAFLTDEQVFRFTYRVDGQPFWQLPLTPYQGSNTYSPFVVVATRT
jgi:HK97 family phage major capsid protein